MVPFTSKLVRYFKIPAITLVDITSIIYVYFVDIRGYHEFMKNLVGYKNEHLFM
jgi:hypothetical protein